MTDAEQTNAPAPVEGLAEQIKAAFGSNMEIKPHTIPPHIAGNLLEFLRRVKSEGMEAIAWVEAYSFVQQHASQQQPGVPFGGLPKK